MIGSPDAPASGDLQRNTLHRSLRPVLACLFLVLATSACGFDDISLDSPAPRASAEELSGSGATTSGAPGGLADEAPRQGLPGDPAPSGYAASDAVGQAARADDPRLRSLRAKRQAAKAVRRELAALNRAKYGDDLDAAPPSAPGDNLEKEQGRERVATRGVPPSGPASGGEAKVRQRLLESISKGESDDPGARAAKPVSARAEPSGAVPDGNAAPFNVQVMALSSRAAVEENWRRLAARHPDLLDGRALVVDPVELPQTGLLYRLQVGPFPGREAAERVCRSLQARGQECFVVRS